MKKILITFLSFLSLSIPTWASLYQVDHIQIEAEMESAQEARTIAIQNGEVDAFWALIKKIVPAEYWDQIELPTDNFASSLIQNVSISDEKLSATKYMASLSVRFKESAVQDFLQDRQIPFLSQDLPSFFVVPIYQKSGETVIFEETNPVFTYLKNNASDRFVLPTGDLEEIEQAKSLVQQHDFKSFSEMATHYDAPHILILTLHHQGPYLTVKASTQPDLFDDISINLTAFDGNITTIMPDLVNQLSEQLLSSWRHRLQEQQPQPDEFLFKVPVQSMAEWTIIHQRLLKTTGLKDIFIRGFKPNTVFLTFSFDGDLDALGQNLSNAHLQLNLQGDVLILQRQEAAQ